MVIPTIVIVGADKGGVGKTTICRALLDYFKKQNKDFRAFDTEFPEGNLNRFFPDTQIVDLTISNDQMKVFDNLSRAALTVIDVRAGLMSPTLKVLSEIGFLDLMKDGKIKIIVFHVVGSTISSLNEIKATSQMMVGAHHFVVKNHINDSAFFDGIESVAKDMFDNETILEIPRMDDRASEYVEASGLSFGAFMIDEGQSLVLRGKVNHWLIQVFLQFDRIKLD
jgi:dethiobiotin synthetase